ncbi:MAG: ubiquitin-like protein Pup [Candidatus Saccharimonadia bacterium]
MAKREQERARPRATSTTTTEEIEIPPTDTADKIKAELDDLLDEIDEVLSENAEEFVRSYVQKGGQ